MRIVKLKNPSIPYMSHLKVGYYEPARKHTLFWGFKETRTLWFPPTIITTDLKNGRFAAFYQLDGKYLSERQGTLTLAAIPLPHCGYDGVCMGSAPTGIIPYQRFWQSAFVDQFNFPHKIWQQKTSHNENPKKILDFLNKKNPFLKNGFKPFEIKFTYTKKFEKEKLDYFKQIQQRRLDKENNRF